MTNKLIFKVAPYFSGIDLAGGLFVTSTSQLHNLQNFPGWNLNDQQFLQSIACQQVEVPDPKFNPLLLLLED